MKSFIENNSNCLSLVKKGKTPFMQESYSKVKKVKNYSDRYKSQLKKCQKRLNKNKYIIF